MMRNTKKYLKILPGTPLFMVIYILNLKKLVLDAV
jgi:hypothetical protein